MKKFRVTASCTVHIGLVEDQFHIWTLSADNREKALLSIQRLCGNLLPQETEWTVSEILPRVNLGGPKEIKPPR